MNIGIPIYKWGIDSQSLSGIETYAEDYGSAERAGSMDGEF